MLNKLINTETKGEVTTKQNNDDEIYKKVGHSKK